MSFLFRKNGSSSRRRIKDKLRGRNSDRGKREEEERVRYDGGSDSLPPPPSPWGFLFPEDFVRIDGNLKAVIVDDEGLDVIYWRKLLELENSGKIRKNPRPRRGAGERGEKSDGGFRRTGADEEDEDDDDEGFYRESGSNQKGDESIEEAFSFHVKKSQSPLSSGGEIRDQSNNSSVDGARYYTSSSTSAASPSRPSSSSTGGVSDYGAVGKQSQSKFQAPGGGSFPSSPSQIPPNQSTGGGGGGGGGGRSPPLPLPPGQFAAAIASSSTSPPPLTVNQTVPHVPANQTSPPPPPPPLAGAPPPPPPPIPATKAPAPPPPPPPGKKAPGPPPPPPMSKTGPPKPPGNAKGPTKAAESSSAIGKEDPAQPKLKPLHWDKVNPDASHSMVWHRIDGGSFK